METRYSLITTIITVCLIVVTALVIATMDTNTTRNLYEGLVLLCCIILFAGSVIMRESIRKA
jgi:uncharacterized membrane protein YgdD (TMEM256/DUF423 family)